MTLVMQRESTEYVFVGIDGTVASGAVEFAFLASGTRPASADWVSGEKVDTSSHTLWEDAQNSDVDGDWYVAKLVGPYDDGTSTNTDVGEGDWQVWIRLTDNPERPVRIAPVTLEVQ